jgi:hypothetical protein
MDTVIGGTDNRCLRAGRGESCAMALPGRGIESDALESGVLDLTDVSLQDLRFIDGADWERSLEGLLSQVSRPRTNFGGTGPPGRAD